MEDKIHDKGYRVVTTVITSSGYYIPITTEGFKQLMVQLNDKNIQFICFGDDILLNKDMILEVVRNVI